MEFDFSSDRPKRGPPARFAARMGIQAEKSPSASSSGLASRNKLSDDEKPTGNVMDADRSS